MKYNTLIPVLFFFLVTNIINAQLDSILAKTKFEMDFRFRAEQDWDSRRSDGSYRDDRTRLRYRLRTGATYANRWYAMGFRIRTGDQNKQQDPQLTLGKGFEEFGTLPLGFEKIFFQANLKNTTIWLGKNSYPFEKNNELFWSDNVYPEGVAVSQSIKLDSKALSQININGGHFILSANDTSLAEDTYFQGLQTTLQLADNRIEVFPSLYAFRNIPNIPDGDHTFLLDYTILHWGTRIHLVPKKQLRLEFDYYHNIEDYNDNVNIEEQFQEEKSGLVAGIKYGSLKQAKAWTCSLSFAALERFSILDYMAQNDWARWDYSSNNSPDGRLSNFNGIEFVAGYAISPKMRLKMKYYAVTQRIPLGAEKETGQRIRFDIDISL